MKKKFYNFDRPGVEEDPSEAQHQVWNYGWQRWNVSYKYKITSTSYKLQVTSYKLQVTSISYRNNLQVKVTSTN